MAIYESKEIISKQGEVFVLRSPELSDIQAYLGYWNAIKIETEFTNQFPEKKAFEISKYEEMFNDARQKNHICMMSLFNKKNEMAGNMDIRCQYPNHPWLGHNCEFGIGLIEKYWGQGLGQLMMYELEAQAQKMGYKRLNGGVRQHNAVARRLYKKLGFEETGSWPEHAFINGRYYDDIMISKKI